MTESLELETERAFASIPSETTPRDRRSLVALQRAVRRASGVYNYLEIGSHLGGTLQPFALDPQCALLWSIDHRPSSQPDERGIRWPYPANTTSRMVANLRRLDAAIGDRLRCIESSTAHLDPAALDARPQLLFVDGEHTDHAVKLDGEFCRQVGDPQGSVIAFHDAHIVYRGLAALFDEWERADLTFTAFVLPDCVMAVALGHFAAGGSHSIVEDSDVNRLVVNNHVAYLWSLLDNHKYRAIANRFPAKQFDRASNTLRRARRVFSTGRSAPHRFREVTR